MSCPPTGVLKFKHESELALMASGLPFTIFRPSRLTDGPYTSYDLNTLLQVGMFCVDVLCGVWERREGERLVCGTSGGAAVVCECRR